jgi:hypothetical protein
MMERFRQAMSKDPIYSGCAIAGNNVRCLAAINNRGAKATLNNE